MDKIFYIKVSLHILAVIGVFLLLGENLEFFKDKDKEDLFNIIKAKSEISIRHPGAQKFWEAFILKNPKYKNTPFDGVDKIIVKGMQLINPHSKDLSEEKVVSGLIKLRNTDGKVSPVICSYDDLRKWSRHNSFWSWVSWSLIAISVLFQIVLFIIETNNIGGVS